MILAAPLGLLALLAVPAVIGIHWFRRRFRPQAVTALWLFGPLAPIGGAGRRRSRVANRASLWWEIAAICALTWYLCDPHVSARTQARHVVVVLDTRGRLEVVGADGRTAQARLLTKLSDRLATLNREDRVTLIATGIAPSVLAGPALPPAQARARLDAWRTQSAWHDVAPAFALASELARGADGRSAQVLFVGDARPAVLPTGCGLLLAGETVPTSGLADARWLPADATAPARIAVRVLAQGAACTRTLRVTAASAGGVAETTSAVLIERKLELLPDQAQLVVVALPAADIAAVDLAFDGTDPLPADDHCRLHRPRSRPVRVWIDLPEPGASAVRRALATMPEVGESLEKSADVLIAVKPPTLLSEQWSVTISGAGGATVLGPYLARRGHALLSDVDFTGCAWRGGAVLEGFAAGAVLLAAGDQALITETETVAATRCRSFAIHADLDGGLFAHPAWPALMANLLSARRAAVPGMPVDVALGQPLTATLPLGAVALMLTDASGVSTQWRPDAGGVVALPGFAQPGNHRTELLLADDTRQAWPDLRVAAIDPRLADCRDCVTADVAPEADGRGDVERTRSALAHLLPLLALAAAALLAWRAFTREEQTT